MVLKGTKGQLAVVNVKALRCIVYTIKNVKQTIVVYKRPIVGTLGTVRGVFSIRFHTKN